MGNKRPSGLLFLISISLIISVGACSGGFVGTSDGGFGLRERTAVGELAFPIDAAQPGVMSVVDAFPSLTFASPLFLTHSPDGTNRIFIVQQGGQIRVFPNSAATTASTVFLDVSALISSPSGEEGLLGLAFDPDYATNGFFYINYTAGGPLRSVVARYQVSANPNVANAGSAQILLQFNQPFANHNGGALAFGPDKMLYIASGDGGSGGDPQNNGQQRNTLLGKILRIDPNSGSPYAIPPDNPFVGQAGSLPEIWAYGLRNPWRFSFDRGSGKLWVADVGQDAWEEINIVNKGDNLGWRFCEGNHTYPNGNPCPQQFVAPIHEYSHSVGQSITGGYVYRGSRLPSLRGAYLYGDFVTSVIFALVHDGTNVTSNIQISTLPQNLSSFGEDQDGEIYAVGYGGKIYKFQEPSGSSNPKFPSKLSETRLFTDVAALRANPGLIEYDVNVALWSDGAAKRRWIAVPDGQTIHFDPSGAWTFPKGTVLVKHFELETAPGVFRRLETRVLVHQRDGWYGYTYRWNALQTDADLLSTGAFEDITITEASGGTRTQRWNYPSRTDCLRCHTQASERVLGVRTMQINRDLDMPGGRDNQIRAWDHVGLFDARTADPASLEKLPRVDDMSATIESRSRAYLATNCAHCHQPGGPTSVNMDLRFATPTASANLIDVAPAAGNLGLSNPARIRRGAKGSSVLWERMRRTDSTRMPPLASSRVDQSAVDVIGAWIDSL
ncbi:MAG: PQQ-dependent sugar dehydrogenase [Bdellovibrionia bacterium]